MLAVGVKESTRFNSVFTCLNLLVVIFVVIAGSFKANIDNWKIEKSAIPKEFVQLLFYLLSLIFHFVIGMRKRRVTVGSSPLVSLE